VAAIYSFEIKYPGQGSARVRAFQYGLKRVFDPFRVGQPVAVVRSISNSQTERFEADAAKLQGYFAKALERAKPTEPH
jgi:hypothetical protein